MTTFRSLADVARRQRGSSMPSPDRRGRLEDGAPEHDVGEAGAEVRRDHASARSWHAAGERLADHRHRVRVAVELAGIAVGEELVAVVDDEQRRVAGHLGGAVRRVVDRHDERVGESQSFVIVWRSVGGRNDAARDDDVRAVDGVARADGATVAAAIPGVAAGGRRRARPPGPGRRRRRAAPAGQDVAEHGQVAAALHPRADQRGRGGPAGDRRRAVPDRDAGDRGRSLGGDRPGVEDRRSGRRSPGR